MTLGIAWIRQGSESKELWIASDSRLSNTDDYLWDSCAKLVTLPRRDAVVGFAGDTMAAFPLMTQMANAVGSFAALHNGVIEFFRFTGHLELIVNDLMSSLKLDPAVHTESVSKVLFSTVEDTIVLAGYSRIANDFIIRTLRYQSDIQRWKFARVSPRSPSGPRVIHVFGDTPSKAQFWTALFRRLEESGRADSHALLDMEPFEVLCDLLALRSSPPEMRNGHLAVPDGYRSTTIGGAPQVIRVLPGSIAMPIVVRWTVDSVTGDYLFGRRLLPYEKVDLPLLADGTGDLKLHAPWHWPGGESDEAEASSVTEPPMAVDEALSGLQLDKRET